MKNTIKYVTKTILWFSLIIPQLALASVDLDSVYFGISTGVKKNGFVAGYGDNLFKSKQPIVNTFIGLEIIQNLNLEINIETNITTKRHSTLAMGEMFLDNLMEYYDDGIYTETYKTNMKIFSLGTDLIYKINLMDCENCNLLFGAGIKLTKANLKTQNVSTGTIIKLTNNNTKALVKLSAGSEYMFTDNYGIRGLVSWENTSVLQPTMIRNVVERVELKAKLKNSMNYTLGVVYKF